MAVGTDTLKRTPLYDRHVAAGARLVPFAGWEMPVQYAGIREEHLAGREGAGVFDVSHMGGIETSGAGAQAFLQRVLSNDVAKIAEGGAQYSVLCREDGGVLDDLFTYRLGDDRYLTVTNAANHERDFAWLAEHADGFDVNVPDAAAAIWDALDTTPIGLGARDTLRLEVCFHLYGNDLSEDRNPIEAGLGWCCKLDTGFMGSDALRHVEPEQ